MKAKFLKRIETEKSNEVKLVMIVDRMSPEVVALEKGEKYEIELCDNKLPNMELSPKEMLSQALTLISQASEGINEDASWSKLIVPCDKNRGDRCVDCISWDKIAPIGLSVTKGKCQNPQSNHYGELQPLYHWCSYWRSRNEEGKADKTADDSQEEKGIRKEVDGEEPDEQGVSGSDGS